MIGTILVPVDGSQLAEHALPFAARIARASGARLVLFRGGLGRPVAEHEPTGSEGIAGLRGEVAEELEAELAKLAGELERQGIAVETRIRFEEAERGILNAVGQEGADLIVMSTHGRSGLGRWIYGSVADGVMREAPVPVLLVPAASKADWPDDRALRLVVPLDGSELARAVLEPVRELAAVMRAELVLVRVVQPPNYAYTTPYPYVDFHEPQELAEAQRSLEQVAHELRAEGRSVNVHAAVGSPPIAITDLARDRDADLIALATHGSGGLVRAVMGSVATGTVQRSTVPLLVVRPAGLD